MKKLYIFLLMGIFFMSLVTPSLDSLGDYKVNESVRVKQVCQDATFINLSSISFPNSTVAFQNIPLTFAGSGEYFFLFNTTHEEGRYDFIGISDGCDKTFATFFIITKTGTQLDTGESLLYLGLLFAVFIFFILSLYFTLVMPYSNKINGKGEPIQITKLKYVKLGLILITYVLFVWFLNVLIAVSDNFVTLTQFAGLMSFLFLLLNRLSYPLAVIIIVMMGIEVVRDSNVKKEIENII